MKKTILNMGSALNKSEQQQINGGRPYLGSTCGRTCPNWNHNGQNVPCGTFIGGFGSECVQCIDPWSGTVGFECHIFNA